MQNDIEIIQINISGADKPGMTSSLTAILARYDACILDIGQANIHQSLTLGILIMTTPDKSAVQGVGIGCHDTLHPDFGGGLRSLGRPPGQEPLHHHAAGPHGLGAPHSRSDGRGGRTRAQHRRHQTADGPHAAARGRPRGQGLHRTFGARLAVRREPQRHAGTLHEPVGTGARRLVPERRHLPPQPPSDMFRHGFDAHRNRGPLRRAPCAAKSTSARASRGA